MIRFFADYVNNVINGDPAHQHAVFIYHRGSYQIVAFEDLCHFVGGQGGSNGFRVGDHGFAHGGARVADQYLGQWQQADELVFPVHYGQVIRGARNFAAATQVALNNFEGDLRAHGDHVRVHQAAGGVFRVAEHMLQPFAVLFVQAGHHLGGDMVRQLLQQIRQVIRVQFFDQRDQFVGGQVTQQFDPDLFAQVLQDFGFLIFMQQLPENFPFPWRGGFQ